jgi:ElaB/YqjD/DUF883 family membrane-anchored ribosome-binding protein
MDIKTTDNVVFPDGIGLPGGLIHSTAASAHGALDRAAQNGHQTIDKVADAAGPSVEWLQKKNAAFQSTQETAVAEVRQYVALHPLRSIGMALAAGFLIAHWQRRGSST